MAPLVAGDLQADAVEVFLADSCRHPRNIRMRDLRGALLEGSVDQTAIEIRIGLRIEAVVQKMMNGDLDGAHVDAAGEPQIGVEQVAVTVFFGRPSPEPFGPGRVAGTGWVTGQQVERNRIAR